MDTPEHRKAEAARADAEDAAGRAAELIADQVRTIVEAAEATASEIRREAGTEADRVRREAEEVSDRVRREAEEESARVRRGAEEESARMRRLAAQTAALVSERIDKVERELTELLRESFATLRREAAGLAIDAPTVSRPAAETSGRSEAAPVGEARARSAARAEARTAEAPGKEALEREPEGEITPEKEAAAPEKEAVMERGAEEGSADEDRGQDEAADAGPHERRGFFRRRAKETYQPRTESSDDPTTAPQDAEGARLIALNMALNGTPREETARYLDSNFELDNADGILDDVYGRVAGA